MSTCRHLPWLIHFCPAPELPRSNPSESLSWRQGGADTIAFKQIYPNVSKCWYCISCIMLYQYWKRNPDDRGSAALQPKGRNCNIIDIVMTSLLAQVSRTFERPSLSPRLLVPSTCCCTCVARTWRVIFEPSICGELIWICDQLSVPCPFKNLFLGSLVPVRTSACCHLQECSCSTVVFGALQRLSGGHMDYLDPFCSTYHAPNPWCSANTILRHLYDRAPHALPFSNKISRICLAIVLWPIIFSGDWEGCNSFAVACAQYMGMPWSTMVL